MKLVILITGIVSCMALVNCGQKTKKVDNLENESVESISTIEISLEENLADSVPYSSLLKHAKLIPLETSDNIIIGAISKVLHFESRFYILDSKTKSVHLFNENGSFIRTIGKLGRGPEEVIDIQDIEIDRKNNNLVLLSVNSLAIQRFNQSGDYISTEKLEFQAFRLAIFGEDGSIAFFINYFDKEPYNLRIISPNKQVINVFPFPKDMFPMYFYFTGGLKSTLTGSVLYSDATSSKVYEVDKEGASFLKYEVDLGEQKWPEEQRYMFQDFFASISGLKSDVMGSNYLETENVFYFDFMDNNTFRDAFYIKRTGKLYVKGINIIGDPLSNIISNPVGCSEEDQFISTINPSSLLAGKTKLVMFDKYQKLFSEIEISDATISNNPILIIYSIYK